MNKDCNASDREESAFDNVDVKLDPQLVSRFLAECEGDLLPDDVDLEGCSLITTSTTTGKTTERKAFASTLQRPSFYQRPVDLDCATLPVGNQLVPNTGGAVKAAKYVSEMHVILSTQPELEDSLNENGSVKYSAEIPQAMSHAERKAEVPKPVEYISGIHVTRSTSGNPEETYAASDVITRFRKEKSAAIITNFLTKLTKEAPASSKPSTYSSKQRLPKISNEILTPSPESSNFISSNEDSGLVKATVYTPTEVSSEVFTQEVTEVTSSTNQTVSTCEYTETTVLPKHMTETGIVQENAFFTSLTKQASSTFNQTNFDSIIQQKQTDSLLYEIHTQSSKATYFLTDDDLPPPLPDQPPPLPRQPPPSLLTSGHMVTSITPEEADFITHYLKTLRTEGETTMTTIFQSIEPLPTDSYSKHQKGTSEHSKKHVSTTQTNLTSVVTKQTPKKFRSPGLPVWPPPARDDSQPPKEESFKPLNSVSSDSSSSESQWEDAEDVELREQVGRVGGNETPNEAATLDKNGSATESWDTGYGGSNTSSHISWSLPEQVSPSVTPGEEELQEKLTDEEVVPKRPSILELLRSNSDAGRKSKPRWYKSVDNDVVLEGLSEKELQLFELEFEMITTEAEYFSRVEFLKKNFLVPNVRYNKKDTLHSDSKKNIFLDLDEVCGCSAKLLADLDNCWKKSVYLEGIFDIVREHSKANISAFINYCAEYEGVIEKISVLRKEDRKFEELVSGLEEGKPDLSEQLKAPMNRIIQLNLLLKNCQEVMTYLSKTENSDVFTNEYESCRSATESVAQLCTKVDEVTGMRRRVQKIIEIQECLEFPLQMTQLSLASQNRWLVKKGAVTQNGYLILNTGKKPAFKKSASVLTVFLFNDLIILTKKKSEECHVVKDYGQRPGVQLSLTKGMEELPRRLVEDTPGYYTMFLSIAKNHMGGTAHIFLSCALESERNDWLDAMTKTSDEYHGL